MAKKQLFIKAICKQKPESKTYIATRTMWAVYRENLVTDN